METTPRIQTAFRLPQGLLARIKREAKREGISVNAFVERTLDRETRLEWPRLPKDYKVSDEILSLHSFSLKYPTEEELAQDPKLSYLWNKLVTPYVKKD
jgi:hypothetical protein